MRCCLGKEVNASTRDISWAWLYFSSGGASEQTGVASAGDTTGRGCTHLRRETLRSRGGDFLCMRFSAVVKLNAYLPIRRDE